MREHVGERLPNPACHHCPRIEGKDIGQHRPHIPEREYEHIRRYQIERYIEKTKPKRAPQHCIVIHA